MKYYTAAEIANYVGVHKNTIYEWYGDGLITANNYDRNGVPLFEKQSLKYIRDHGISVIQRKRERIAEKKERVEYQQTMSSLKDRLKVKNQKVHADRTCADHYVARLDDDGNVQAVFLNRNQAVRSWLMTKGFSNPTSITIKYLSWNGALKLQMHNGRRFQGSFYIYVSKDEYTPTVELSVWGFQKPCIVVDNMGVETNFNSIKDVARNFNTNYEKIKHHINSGAPFDKIHSIYTVGSKMEFENNRDAIRYYRIGKDKFRKLMEQGKPIRGHQVEVKEP